MARTAEMFHKPPTVRRVLMHWDDCGHDGEHPMGNFVCGRCGFRAGWLSCSEKQMRGIPCPKCSGGNSPSESTCRS